MPKIKISGLKFRSIIQILGFGKLKFKKNHSKKTKVFWGLGYGEGQDYALGKMLRGSKYISLNE